MATAAGDVLSALMIGGLMGLVGQGARVAVGLKKMNDLASDSDSNLGWSDVFVASRLIISLIIGFLAGVVAAIAIGVGNISTAFSSDMLIKLAAAGYAGTDAIEAFTARLASSAPTTTNQPPAPKPLSNDSAVQLTAKMSALNANMATLSGSLAAAAGGAPPPGSKDASAAELAQDMQEAKKYLTGITDAATQYGLAPSLICAIGSRESNWGQGSDMRPKGPAGTGDWAPRNPAVWGYAMPPDGLGWGRGLMQVDYAESDFGKTGAWRDPTANILFGANELETNIKHFTASPTSGVDPMRAAVAAYNCGQGNVAKAIANGFDVDHYTTGGDYSTDVMGRAAWFKANGFDNQPLVS